jgi:hypothetical protein
LYQRRRDDRHNCRDADFALRQTSSVSQYLTAGIAIAQIASGVRTTRVRPSRDPRGQKQNGREVYEGMACQPFTAAPARASQPGRRWVETLGTKSSKFYRRREKLSSFLPAFSRSFPVSTFIFLGAAFTFRKVRRFSLCLLALAIPPAEKATAILKACSRPTAQIDRTNSPVFQEIIPRLRPMLQTEIETGSSSLEFFRRCPC